MHWYKVDTEKKRFIEDTVWGQAIRRFAELCLVQLAKYRKAQARAQARGEQEPTAKYNNEMEPQASTRSNGALLFSKECTQILFIGLMAVERVASASVPDVAQTDSTTTMPVALARRAEGDLRTWVRKSRPPNATLRRPAAGTPRHCAQFSAVCLLWWADCSTLPGQGPVSYTRAGGQPA
jgi:hypothetical protein